MMKEKEFRQRSQEVISLLHDVGQKAAHGNLWKTYHAIKDAEKAVGYEVAEALEKDFKPKVRKR